MNGFDDSFVSPHSRYTEVTLEDIKNKTDLDVVASGQEVGLSILANKDLREVYSFGHFEYDRDTLAREYRRDLEVGINPDVPANYFPGTIQVRNQNFVGTLRHQHSLVIGLTTLYIKKHPIV